MEGKLSSYRISKRKEAGGNVCYEICSVAILMIDHMFALAYIWHMCCVLLYVRFSVSRYEALLAKQPFPLSKITVKR